jgi:hypothetical protein
LEWALALALALALASVSELASALEWVSASV